MKDFDPCQHFGFLANRVAKLISDDGKAVIESKGYSFVPSCIGILAELWHEDGINQKDLSMSLYKSKSTINKMLLALEKDGLIERVDVESDKRYKKIFLTTAGRSFKKAIEKESGEMEKKLRKKFNKEQIQITKEVFREMMEILSKQSQNKVG